MANMREIRNRMKSIQDTMKITKAMYVVSSSKLKKAQKQYDRTKPYYKALSNTMADIMEHIEPEVTHKYINDKPPVDESKVNRLFIVVTADKGHLYLTALTIYAASLILLYAASTTYHTVDISEKVNTILKKRVFW